MYSRISTKMDEKYSFLLFLVYIIHKVWHQEVSGNVGNLRGVAFRPLNLEKSILRYGLRGKARTRPDILGVVLGPCAQFCPYEASEQK